MDITISLELNDAGLLIASSEVSGQYIGTIGDNNAQTLIFERGDLTGNLQLDFLVRGAWQSVNIGTDTEYVITNSLTVASSFDLLPTLIDGDTTITGANRLTFNYRVGGSTSGTTPSEIDSDWINIKTNAMLKTTYDTDGDGVIDADALPLSSAIDSDSEDTAATSKAVKTAYDLAATKKTEEYGLFVDSRSTATTGYWHKLFTCKINAYSSTDINMRLSVMELFQGGNYPCGDLNLNIRQSTNGVLSTNKLMWLNANVDLTNYLNRFALNVVADSTGNYVELYIYDNAVYHGYKVSVSDKSPGASTHTLTFTGDVNWSATTTLTELPTNGTIVYSTLSAPLASIANATASITTINNSLTALNTVSTYDPSTYLADGVTINSNYSYIKKIGSQVYIQLFVTSTTSSSDTILTLPEDVRPLTQDWSFCGGAYGGSAYGRANINTTGAVGVTISAATANLFIKTTYVVDTASTLSATALSSTSTIEQILAELGGTI